MKLPGSILFTTRRAAVVLCTIIMLLAASSSATNISSCTTISTSGSYIVIAPLSCAGDAILITASNVKLHLAGFTISASGNAIHAKSVKSVEIVGPGTATTADAGCGVLLEGVTDSQVIGVTATQNAIGICLFEDSAGTVSAHNRVVANKANVNTTGIQSDVSQSNLYLGNECSNEGTGIFIASGQFDVIEGNKCNTNTTGIEFVGTSEMVTGNETDGNTNVGIFLQGGTGNHLRNNEATSNGVDLDDNNGGPPCVNTWRLDAFVTSNTTCIN